MGIFLIVSGLIFYLFLKFFGFLFYSVSSISFLKWVGGGRNSKVFSLLKYFNLEHRWMEFFGGGGTFFLL